MLQLSQKTIDKQERAKRMSSEDRARIEKAMNEFVSKDYKKCINTAKRRFYTAFGDRVPQETIEDYVQDIFLYMYINYDVTFRFDENNREMYKLFCLILWSRNQIFQMRMELYKHCNQFDESVYDNIEYEEDPPLWSPGGVDPKMPYEERKYLHELALEETKQYLLDNPDSPLNEALRLARAKSYNNYIVGLHYIATPSYTWLFKVSKEYGMKATQNAIDFFKRCLEQAYGKKTVKNAIAHYKT